MSSVTFRPENKLVRAWHAFFELQRTFTATCSIRWRNWIEPEPPRSWRSPSGRSAALRLLRTKALSARAYPHKSVVHTCTCTELKAAHGTPDSLILHTSCSLKASSVLRIDSRCSVEQSMPSSPIDADTNISWLARILTPFMELPCEPLAETMGLRTNGRW